MNFQNTHKIVNIVLSVGDESGIGPEIILKALYSDELPDNIDFTLVGSKKNLLNVFRNSEYSFIDISDDELSKNHLRHMVGGRLPRDFKEMDYGNFVELLYRFEFPERPGALINFLNNMKSNWSISVFHYRNYGADVGKIVIGVLIDRNEILEWNKFVRILGYKFWDETQNATYKLFLGASD